MGLKLHKEAFTNSKMGYASAISWVMFLIIMVVTLLLFRFSSAWVSYQNIVWPEGEWPRLADAQGNPVPHVQPALNFRTPDAEETAWPEEPVRTVFADGISHAWMTLRRCWPRRGISLTAR